MVSVSFAGFWPIPLANKILAFWGPSLGGFSSPAPCPDFFKKVTLWSVDFPAIFKFNQIGFCFRKYLTHSVPLFLPTVLFSGVAQSALAKETSWGLKQCIPWSQACKMRTLFFPKKPWYPQMEKSSSQNTSLLAALWLKDAAREEGRERVLFCKSQRFFQRFLLSSKVGTKCWSQWRFIMATPAFGSSPNQESLWHVHGNTQETGPHKFKCPVSHGSWPQWWHQQPGLLAPGHTGLGSLNSSTGRWGKGRKSWLMESGSHLPGSPWFSTPHILVLPAPESAQSQRSSQLAFILLSFFWPCYGACRILVPQPGIEPMSPALEAWNLNCWTIWEVW